MLYTFSELCGILQIDEPTALALQQSGHLPTPVFIGERAVRWVEDKFAAWVADGCKPSLPMSADAFQLLRELVAEENFINACGDEKRKHRTAILSECKEANKRRDKILSRTFFIEE
jgi:predicted DNA-binding transcriptional regulator AlpA